MATKPWRKLYGKLHDNALFATLSIQARYIFQTIIIHADDEGLHTGDEVFLKGKFFSHDRTSPKSIKQSLVALEKAGFINLYEVRGKAYIEIPNFRKYQGGRAKDFTPTSLPRPQRAEAAQSERGESAVSAQSERGDRVLDKIRLDKKKNTDRKDPLENKLIACREHAADSEPPEKKKQHDPADRAIAEKFIRQIKSNIERQGIKKKISGKPTDADLKAVRLIRKDYGDEAEEAFELALYTLKEDYQPEGRWGGWATQVYSIPGLRKKRESGDNLTKFDKLVAWAKRQRGGNRKPKPAGDDQRLEPTEPVLRMREL
ncbi:hypothetical protein J7K50_02190 [bacterium]|nr:hypothetical protein [bacterium]